MHSASESENWWGENQSKLAKAEEEVQARIPPPDPESPTWDRMMKISVATATVLLAELEAEETQV